MNEPPELIEKLRQWVEKAEEDYTVALVAPLLFPPSKEV